MVTREQAKERALEMINQIIRTEGGQSIGLTKKQKGKNSWTNIEIKNAIIHDCNLPNGPNPIDEIYDSLVYMENHGM